MKIRLRTRVIAGIAGAFRRLRRAIDASDILTFAALGCLWLGLALVSVPLAFVIVGALLILVTPIGAAIRIMIRGR